MTGRVFTEGPTGLELVGDFQGLYLTVDDPWSQSGADDAMGPYYRHSRAVLIEALRRHKPGNGIEVGCGHGYLTEALQDLLRAPVVGMDVSGAAVRRAEQLHPGHVFVTGDIAGDRFLAPGRFGFVLWAQVLWYVLERLDTAVANSLDMLEPGGLFVISQAFLRDQRYGRDIADGFDGTVALFLERGFRLIEARHDDTDRLCHRDGLLIFRKGT